MTAAKSDKSIYISLFNEDTPNKIVINGVEIDTEGMTYLALEMKPLQRVKYVIAKYGVKVSSKFVVSVPEEEHTNNDRSED